MTERAKGVDVSHHQPALDWPTLRAAGYSFCSVKLTEGETYTDPKAEEHWKGAQAAGLMVGGYHYYRPRRDPKRQAAHFAATLERLGGMSLPPALDVETDDKTKTLAAVPSSVILAGCKVFLAEVRRLTGWRPLVYSYAPFLDQHGLGALAGEAELWLAAYVSEKRLKKPKGWADWRLWQYSGSGSAPGAKGEIDLNVAWSRYEDLANWAKSQRVG